MGNAVEKLRVLVVDDEPGMRTGVQRALSRFQFALPEMGKDVSFTIEQAETGEQALEMIRTDRPDLLLLDHRLPGISGLDVLRQIGETEDMLTVMITAYASLETAVSAIKQGAYDFLAKPFTPMELKGTVRKAAEALVLVRQARQLASEKRQIRFEFTQVLAHELKSPLNTVEGYLRIIRDRTAGDDPRAYEHMLDRCLTRLQDMRKLIMDLLDLTHIESGKKQRNLQRIDVVDVARRAIETAGPDAQARRIALELHADGPVTMTAEEGEIEIVLNNLVSNAVKYNRDGGRVDITIAADADRVSIAVADTGIGMTPEDAERVFEEFVRIKTDQTRSITGSGLGLSIVKKLAVLYGGNVSVTSRPDVGSTFTVTLNRDGNADGSIVAETTDAGA